ncbi:hypothetical protein GGR56DRAFT_161021 [Xylariaceae sp. FL0804]|nr:hypothetical protein GGR56DRAFT_161021 [Xylariaceae sp. FL0804]
MHACRSTAIMRSRLKANTRSPPSPRRERTKASKSIAPLSCTVKRYSVARKKNMAEICHILIPCGTVQAHCLIVLHHSPTKIESDQVFLTHFSIHLSVVDTVSSQVLPANNNMNSASLSWLFSTSGGAVRSDYCCGSAHSATCSGRSHLISTRSSGLSGLPVKPMFPCRRR